MTAPVLMTPQMEARVRQQVHEILSHADITFGRTLTRRMTQPMSTISFVTKFTAKTPSEGTREFVVTISVAEQSSPDGNPTAGWNDRT